MRIACVALAFVRMVLVCMVLVLAVLVRMLAVLVRMVAVIMRVIMRRMVMGVLLTTVLVFDHDASSVNPVRRGVSPPLEGREV